MIEYYDLLRIIDSTTILQELYEPVCAEMEKSGGTLYHLLDLVNNITEQYEAVNVEVKIKKTKRKSSKDKASAGTDFSIVPTGKAREIRPEEILTQVALAAQLPRYMDRSRLDAVDWIAMEILKTPENTPELFDSLVTQSILCDEPTFAIRKKGTDALIISPSTAGKMYRQVMLNNTMTNDTFSHALQLSAQRPLAFESHPSIRGQKPTNKVVMTMGDPRNDIVPQSYGRAGRVIHDAVLTLCNAGQTAFTPEQINKVITGNPKSTISKARREEIVRVVESMSITRITIDATAEARTRGIKDVNSATIKANLLNTEWVDIKLSSGAIVKGWRLLSEPALLHYAQSIGHGILYVDPELFKIKTTEKKGDEIILLDSLERVTGRREIIRHALILTLYWGKGERQKIYFKHLFQGAGIDEVKNPRNVAQDARDYVYICLDYWVAYGVLREWSKLKNDAGVEIFVNRAKLLGGKDCKPTQ